MSCDHRITLAEAMRMSIRAKHLKVILDRLGMPSASYVTSRTVVVVEEYCHKCGELVNPRIQFTFELQSKAVRETLNGKRVGQTVIFNKNKNSAKILSINSYGVKL